MAVEIEVQIAGIEDMRRQWRDNPAMPAYQRMLFGDICDLALSALRPSPSSDERVKADWHPWTELPVTPKGTARYFVVAVRRMSGEIFSFPAQYLHDYPLQYDGDGCMGLSTKHCPDDGSHEDGCPTTGWFDEVSSDSYDSNYTALRSHLDNQYLAWSEMPRFSPDSDLPGDERVDLRDSVIEDTPDQYVLITRGFFWRPNSAGYTHNLPQAGIYTEAESAARINGDVTRMKVSDALRALQPHKGEPAA